MKKQLLFVFIIIFSLLGSLIGQEQSNVVNQNFEKTEKRIQNEIDHIELQAEYGKIANDSVKQMLLSDKYWYKKWKTRALVAGGVFIGCAGFFIFSGLEGIIVLTNRKENPLDLSVALRQKNVLGDSVGDLLAFGSVLSALGVVIVKFADHCAWKAREIKSKLWQNERQLNFAYNRMERKKQDREHQLQAELERQKREQEEKERNAKFDLEDEQERIIRELKIKKLQRQV